MNTVEIDKKYIVNTYARQNVVFVKGKGSTLYDADDNAYIDFGTGIAVNGLGHSNKKWLSAVKKQASKLVHTSNLYYNMPSANLAKMLIERTDFAQVFLCNSGAEANECAIKTARKYASDKGFVDRYKIITLKQSFHGRTLATLTATGQENFHKHFLPLLEGFIYATPNDFEDIKSKICDKTCAIMLELVQGEGGVMPLDIDYVQKIAKLCNDKDILLIVDEVQTGNGRTGELYAYMHYGIVTDILTTAKGLANGLPIGCTLFTEKTKSTLKKGDHGSTFGGNPVSCAAALATLMQLDKKLMDKVKLNAQKIKHAVSGLSKVKSVSGLGLMIGIACDNASKVQETCLEKGLIVLTAKDKLRLLPALNISDKELHKGLQILTEVLK